MRLTAGRMVDFEINGIERFCLEDGQKIALLDHVEECYLGNFAMDRKLREEERPQIGEGI